jgi:hypothetical protein
MEGGATWAAAVATWALVRARVDVLVGVVALCSCAARRFLMSSRLAKSVGMLLGVTLLCTLRTAGCASMERVILLLISSSSSMCAALVFFVYQCPGNFCIPALPGNFCIPTLPGNFGIPALPGNFCIPTQSGNFCIPTLPGNFCTPTLPGNFCILALPGIQLGGVCTLRTCCMLGVCTLGTHCMLGVAEGVAAALNWPGCACTWAFVASMIRWRSCAA